MSWTSVRGHDRVREALEQAWVQNRFPHSLLFVGPDGVGRRLFALTLAQTLLCARREPAVFEPCGVCPDCQQVSVQSHPDLLLLSKPEEKHELPIEGVRQLNGELSRTPLRGKHRVAIVDHADDLSEEASNAFLKTLEEPPPGALLILIGSAPELQLDTVLSRCRVVRFEPLATKDLEAILLEQQLVETPEIAATLAAQAEGSVSRAVALADPELAPFLDNLLATISDPRGFLPPGLAREIDTFAKQAGKDSAVVRERARLLTAELARHYRGGLLVQHGLTPGTLSQARGAAARSLADHLPTEALLAAIERCLQADYQIARKAYLPLVFDALAQDLAELRSATA